MHPQWKDEDIQAWKVMNVSSHAVTLAAELISRLPVQRSSPFTMSWLVSFEREV